jgi:hypothetical protein
MQAQQPGEIRILDNNHNENGRSLYRNDERKMGQPKALTGLKVVERKETLK